MPSQQYTPGITIQVGSKYGHLTVLRELESVFYPSGDRARIWECQCDCGKITSVRSVGLRWENRACGCIRRASKIIHNESGIRVDGDRERASREFIAWCSLKRRCTAPSSHDYKYYGGRGIKVCERWLESFENFLADMGRKPGPEYSIDRYPDNNGNYEPGNCRWATRLQQARNSRSSKILTFLGETLPIPEWAERKGIQGSTIAWRIRSGWSVERALNTPPSRARGGKGANPIADASPAESAIPGVVSGDAESEEIDWVMELFPQLVVQHK